MTEKNDVDVFKAYVFLVSFGTRSWLSFSLLEMCRLVCRIDETEDLTYTSVAHTPSEADITNITDITHVQQDVRGYGHIIFIQPA